jgi:hypothetical protein
MVMGAIDSDTDTTTVTCVSCGMAVMGPRMSIVVAVTGWHEHMGAHLCPSCRSAPEGWAALAYATYPPADADPSSTRSDLAAVFAAAMGR